MQDKIQDSGRGPLTYGIRKNAHECVCIYPYTHTYHMLYKMQYVMRYDGNGNNMIMMTIVTVG